MKLNNALYNVINEIVEHGAKIRWRGVFADENNFSESAKNDRFISFCQQVLKLDMQTLRTLVFISFVGTWDDEYFDEIFHQLQDDYNALFNFATIHAKNESTNRLTALMFSRENWDLELLRGLKLLGLAC